MRLCINHIVTTPLFIYFAMYPLAVWRGVDLNLSSPVSLVTAIAHLAGCIVVEDALFYWSHRMLHHGLLYARIHKVCCLSCSCFSG